MTAAVTATADVATCALASMLDALDWICNEHGLTGVPAAKAKFIACIHALATVAQRAGLTKEYVAERVGEMLPRAMDASEADEHIDIHHGSVPS